MVKRLASGHSQVSAAIRMTRLDPRTVCISSVPSMNRVCITSGYLLTTHFCSCPNRLESILWCRHVQCLLVCDSRCQTLQELSSSYFGCRLLASAIIWTLKVNKNRLFYLSLTTVDSWPAELTCSKKCGMFTFTKIQHIYKSFVHIKNS